MNILIGIFVVLLIAMAVDGQSSSIERRHADPPRHAVTDEPLDNWQRQECASWRGWPDHYHPWYCGK
jgi:hypothetical protein